MPFSSDERTFVASADVGRLATVDESGTPHIVPVCLVFVGDAIVSAIDTKPKAVGPEKLQRVRNVEANPAVSLLVDRYSDDWDELAWVRVDGHARIESPNAARHGAACSRLQKKYPQYEQHPLAERPLLVIEPRHVSSWGSL